MATEQQANQTAKRGITLPPMPDSLQRLATEREKAEPDADKISEIVSSDVSLSAEVLKVINSPLFTRNRSISSIHTAILLLGIPNVFNITASVALRHAMDCGDNKVRLERFWDTAGDVAYAAASYARIFSGVTADMAYTMGLFHDCGIPVMMCRYSDYIETLSSAEKDIGIDLLELENSRYPFNHAQLGEMICKSWKLPPVIGEAIGHHHNLAALIARNEQVNEVVVSLVAILKMAEHTSRKFRGLAFRGDERDDEWEKLSTMVLSHFDLEAEEFYDRMEQVVLELGQR